jgi:hypothetical protein
VEGGQRGEHLTYSYTGLGLYELSEIEISYCI